jgi:hypothetical protein
MGIVLALETALLLTAGAPAPPPIPDLNARVVAFARANLGGSVGDGSCNTLAIEALKAAGAKDHPIVESGGNFVWGRPVDSFKKALPGDILQFHQAVFRGKRMIGKRRWVTWHYEYPHHTAIVARVSEGGNVVVVLHQNVIMTGKPEDDAKNVQEGTLRIDSLQEGGWVRIYRPVAVASLAPTRAGTSGEDVGDGADPLP